MSAPMRFRIYLDTGAVIEFAATDLVRETSNTTGKLTKLSYEGATGDVPRYVDLDHVVAITRDVPKGSR